MKKYILISILCLWTALCFFTPFQGAQANDMSAFSKAKIAVIWDSGDLNKKFKEYDVEAKNLIEPVVTNVKKAKIFKSVIERQDVLALIKEIKFSQTAFVNENDKKKLGRIQGADLLFIVKLLELNQEEEQKQSLFSKGLQIAETATGSGSHRATVVKVNAYSVGLSAKVVDLKSGKIFFSSSATDKSKKNFTDATMVASKKIVNDLKREYKKAKKKAKKKRK